MSFQNFNAGGTIYPARFVILSNTTATQGNVTQATSATSAILYGISQKEVRRSPYIDSSEEAALANEPVGVYDLGEECLLQVGSGNTVLPGDLLTSDSSGCALTTTTSGNFVGAVALMGGSAGDQIKVKVIYMLHS